jgi:methylated-DNA-[protein]-cysteine S-methyltransferase
MLETHPAPVSAVLLCDEVDTPLGRLLVVTAENGAVHLVGWLDAHERSEKSLLALARAGRAPRRATNPGGASAALRAYFDGQLRALDTLPVADIGTPFQREVWRALRAIPCGTTLSYSALARRIRRPSAVRAVGLANGKNPINIIVPCHRVIGADGTLTGYGGGLERKRWLLEHERATAALTLPFAPHPSG